MLNSKNLIAAMAIPVLMAASTTGAEAATITFSNQAGESGGNFDVLATTVRIGDGNMGGSAADGRISRVAATPGPATAVTGVCGGFGCLELQTGLLIGADAGTTANDYLYTGAGSSIRIYGTADGAINTLLYSGSYDTNVNIRLTFDDNCTNADPGCSGSLGGTLAGGLLDPTLAAFLGVVPNTLGGNATNLFFDFVTQGTFGGAAPPIGSGVANTNSLQTNAAAPVVPEPGSMLLLGTGLLGLARAARRRMARA